MPSQVNRPFGPKHELFGLRQLPRDDTSAGSHGKVVRSRHPMSDPEHDHDTVLAANQRFYDAFEAGDLDAMSDLWSHGPGTACTHPGWGTLQGWGAISSSWFAIFQGPAPAQFILTNPQAHVSGDVAWVTVDENLIGIHSAQTVAAVNIFERQGGGWKMVCHHGSPVADRDTPDG